MHNALRVQVIDRREDLRHEPARVLLRVRAVLDDAIKELAAVHVLHHHAEPRRLVKDLKESNDVRMLDRHENVDLLPNRLDVEVLVVFVEHLHRNLCLICAVLAKVHRRELALANGFHQLVLLLERCSLAVFVLVFVFLLVLAFAARRHREV
eukprot:Amastigsp_a178256_125.p2 type:complete len:152 gc:universal Amastigsp_a178256_125:575-1030(+)